MQNDFCAEGGHVHLSGRDVSGVAASAFIGTDLDLLLRSRGIKTLLMTGVVSHCCVQATAWDGFMLDYYVVYVADCTAGRRDSLHQATLENFEIYCGDVLNAADVAQLWQAQPVRTRV